MTNRRRKAAGILALAMLYSISIVMGVDAEKYEYDKLNRLTKVTYDTGEIITYEYDGNGNVRSVHSSKSDNIETDDTDKKEESNLGGDSTNNQGATGSGGASSNQTSAESGGTSSNQSSAGSGDTSQNEGQSQDDNTNQHPQEVLTQKLVKTKKANYTIFFKDSKVSDVQLTTFKDKKAKSFTIPNTIKYKGKKYKVTSIGEKAFYKKTKLQKLIIGKYVKTIGTKAIYGDKKLTSITVKSSKLTNVGSNALKGTSKKLKIKVPSKKVAKYKKLFKNKGNKKVKITKR